MIAKTSRKPGAVRQLPLLAVFLFTSNPAWSLDNTPWGNLKTEVGPDAEVPGWFINLGITGARAMITQEAPTQLQVMFVFKKSPAFGKLEVGDKITGANKKTFSTAHKFGYGVGKFGYQGPMMDFANALEESQGKLDGKLVLDVLRGDKKLQVELQVSVKYGAFSETYPFQCKKSNFLLKESCDWLCKAQLPDGTWSDRPHINAFAAMALLGSGDKRYLTEVKKAMNAMAERTTGTGSQGLPTWDYTLYGTALAEYYLITREKWVLKELEEINQWLVQAQQGKIAPPETEHISGGFGHGFYTSGANGYGGMNITTAQAMTAWSLMERCGIPVDRARLAAAHEFIAKGTNEMGYVWYADAVGGDGYADMGRTGASAVAHFVDAAASPKFTSFSKRNARCIGKNPDTFTDTHGCPLLGLVWTGLGAATDPASLRKLMDHNRWSFSLSQCADGSFYYQPNRDNNPQDYTAGPRLAATAATALVLSIKEKKLQITGAPPVLLPPIAKPK
ncbi:MAG: hypothetical protein RLZZ282_1764 [Verrucomicrobiota bacterium]